MPKRDDLNSILIIGVDWIVRGGAAVRAILAMQSGKINYHSLQEIFNQSK